MTEQGGAVTRDEALEFLNNLAVSLEKKPNKGGPWPAQLRKIARMIAALESPYGEPLAEGTGYVAKVGGKLFPQNVSLVKGGCFTEYARFIILRANEEPCGFCRGTGIIVEPDTCKEVSCFCRADEETEEEA